MSGFDHGSVIDFPCDCGDCNKALWEALEKKPVEKEEEDWDEEAWEAKDELGEE